jgi:hypothetical protein
MGAPLRPAEIVAARVRDVLRDHADDRAWQELAGALPELALSGGADLESTFEAARLAEEMNRPVARTAPAAPLPLPVRPSSWSYVVAGIRAVDLDLVAQALALALGVFALTRVVKGSASRSRSSASGTPAVRCRQARALAAEGLQPHEIARRTGLGQDAVSVLLGRRAD